MLIQAVDLQESLRIDMFSDFGGQVRRSKRFDLQTISLHPVSLEDLAARACAISTDVAHGKVVPSKHGRDFVALLDVINSAEVEIAWRDHPSSTDPTGFTEAAQLVRQLIDSRAIFKRHQ